MLTKSTAAAMTVLLIISENKMHKESVDLFTEVRNILIETSDAEIAFIHEEQGHLYHDLVLCIVPEGTVRGAMPQAGILQDMEAKYRWMGIGETDSFLVKFGSSGREPNVPSMNSPKFDALKHARAIRNAVPAIYREHEMNEQSRRINRIFQKTATLEKSESRRLVSA